MPEKKQKPSWLADSLRVTLFPLGDFAPSSSWWKQVTDAEPESTSARPAKGEHQEEGPFHNGNLILRVEPLRIDWIYTKKSNDAEVIPSLGTLANAVETFHAAIKRWIPLAPESNRLAFGAVLLQPVPDKMSGYQVLSSFLPSVDLDPENSSDFRYRINRRRPSSSSSADLRINRLSTWSVASFRGLRFSPSQPTSVHSMPEHYACHLELDINTAPEFAQPIPHNELDHLLSELIQLASEITEKGDIP